MYYRSDINKLRAALDVLQAMKLQRFSSSEPPTIDGGSSSMASAGH